MPEVNRVLAQMRALQRGGALGRVEGLHRQGDHGYRQHRHRRLGPGPEDGLRGAQAVCQARPARPFRLQRGPHRPGRDAEEAEPGDDAVPGGLQDLHHPGDDDQRPLGAALVPGGGERRGRHRPAFRRHVHQHGRGEQVRHRHRQHVRVLGLGRRALLAVVGHRPVDRPVPGHGPL